MERTSTSTSNNSCQVSKALISPSNTNTSDTDDGYEDERKEEEEESEDNEDETKVNDMISRKSSSNSTVEENGSKRGSNSGGSVRQYVRSKTPRLRWTPDLHLCFIRAIERLGGQERATPKLVLQMMNVKGLSIAHVKSHLQMYRSKKIEEPNYHDRGFFLEGGDHQHIYNLSQLPMLQSFNQWSSSGLRYGDSSLRSRDHCKIYTRATMNAFDSTKHGDLHGFYGSISKRHFSTNNNFIGSTQTMSPKISPSWRSRHQISHESRRSQNVAIDNPRPRELDEVTMINGTTLAGKSGTSNTSTSIQQGQQNKLKRKALNSEYNNSDLDLDLSLNITPRDLGDQSEKGLVGEENQVGFINNSLTLSLSTSNLSSSNIISRLKEESHVMNKKHGKILASTLDLTL